MSPQDIEAEYLLGCEAYSRGDYGVALEKWRPIAIQGHSKAQYRVGCLHGQGQGTNHNDSEAMMWFGLAAEQGDPDAQYALGERYLTGIGVSRVGRSAIGGG